MLKFLPQLTARQIRPAVAVSLVLSLMVAGVSLWTAAPWKENSPAPPDASPGRADMQGVKGVPGPRSGPAPRFLEQSSDADRSQIEPGEHVNVTSALRNVWDRRI